MKKEYLLIIAMAVIKFVLPFLLQHPSFELHRDEYLYFEQGKHLDWGYLENPPLIGLMASISDLFGGSFFWIKFWPSFMGSLTLIITAGIVKELGGSLFAIFISSLAFLATAYLRVHFLFQPNMLDIFFWTLSAYLLLVYLNKNENKYLYCLSIALALAVWGKYSVLFFIGALLLSLLLTRQRNLFANKHFWLAILLGCLVIMPNVIWQYQHNWPLVHHMNELQQTQLQYISKADFIKEQILMLLPVILVWMGGLIWFLHNEKYRLIAYLYLITIALLMLGSGKGYYALGSYPMLLAGGAVWLERLTKKKLWLRYAFTFFILILALPFIPLLLPMQEAGAMAISNKKYGLEKLGILKWEDQQSHALQQDFADMQGWKELATKTETFYHTLPITVQANTICYCRNYGQAGAVKYFASDKQFSSKTISDNGSFLLWIPGRLYFKNLIFIGASQPEKNDEVFALFQKVTLIDSVGNPLSRQYGNKIIFYEQGTDTAYQLANKKIKEAKAEFGE